MRDLLIQLNLLPGVGTVRLEALMRRFRDLEAFRRATLDELIEIGLPSGEARSILRERERRPVEAEKERASTAGVQIVTSHDADYPPPLRELRGAPPVLYVRGTLVRELDSPAIGVVGTRRPTPYGRGVAHRLGRALARAGITVVSGLARGVDGAAHRGVLDAGGRTLAVLGSGLDRCYPAEHRPLLETITRAGAAVSEFALGCPPLPANFPRRNRIIAGLVRGVVVVEAAERSGSLITARLALEQGREVFAVPGPITSATSRGTHALLRKGARLLGGIEDIFEELDLRVELAEPPEDSLTDEERRVLEWIGPEPVSTDHLIAETGLPADRLGAVLALLEVKDRIRDVGGGRVVAL
jgi:DNA processing protein